MHKAKMKTIVFITALICATASVRAEELKWQTDAAKAQAQAKTEKKLVFLDFTGSDWCGWCIKLNKEVFSQPEFATYAKKNLVLVEVDFPRNKQQSAEQAKANQALQSKYGIESYPTIIVLDGDGKKIGQLRYMRGGPKSFLEALDKLKKQAS